MLTYTKNNCLVSIVITYYKKKKFLSKTLNSIKSQIYNNYEIIFVYDDPDLSDIHFVKKSLSIFKKKKLLVNSRNLGVAKSRNRAMKYCRGTYLAFIDSDDLWKKNKLSYQLNIMERYSSLFSFTSYDVIDEKDKLLKKREVNNDGNFSALIKSNFIGLSTVMIHRSLYKKIMFPKLQTQEDFALWLKISREGHKLRHIKKSLSCWRKSEGSLSSSISRRLIDAFLLYYIYLNKNFVYSIYSVLVLSFYKLKKEIF